jgi:hypothetical protein
MRKTMLACFLFSLTAMAMDVSGRWRGEAVTNGEAHPVYLTLIQEGAVLKGTGGPGPMEQSPMQSGKVEGNKITFDIFPGANQPLHFELVLDGQDLKGTMAVRHNGQTVTGKVSLRKRSN